jgi:hypothetical protein
MSHIKLIVQHVSGIGDKEGEIIDVRSLGLSRSA